MRRRVRLTPQQQRILRLVDVLGWASGPLLAFLNGTEVGHRDYYLEKYLPRLVRQGLLRAKPWGRQRIYRLPAYGTGRNPNIEHALAAGWVVARLVRSASISTDAIVSRGALVEAGLPQVPDGGVILPTASGQHLFLVEYQTPREAERTTQDKIEGYRMTSERTRKLFSVEGVWVLFILDVLRQRAEEIAQRSCDGWPLFFFCDRETFMSSDWRYLFTTPIFFWSRTPGVHSLATST